MNIRKRTVEKAKKYLHMNTFKENNLNIPKKFIYTKPSHTTVKIPFIRRCSNYSHTCHM